MDIFNKVRKHVPLDLVGMGTEEIGLGEVLHPQLPEFISRYRFFFNPIRYTSFGLAVCEAMMTGLPVVGMATTEMPAIFSNGVNGIIHTNIDYLIEEMISMIHDKERAVKLGKTASKRHVKDLILIVSLKIGKKYLLLSLKLKLMKRFNVLGRERKRLKRFIWPSKNKIY